MKRVREGWGRMEKNEKGQKRIWEERKKMKRNREGWRRMKEDGQEKNGWTGRKQK